MHRPQNKTLSFNEFTLDLTRGCLFRDSEEVKLRPKSFETLKHLVENCGRLISKDELIATVWPDTSVTDDSLVQCLIEVRRALGENAQQIVKTVPRRGYIFEAEVIPNRFAKGELVYTDEVEKVSITIEDETDEDSIEHARRALVAKNSLSERFFSRTALTSLTLVAVSLAGLGVWFIWSNRSKASPPAIRALAVLPLKSQIPESQNDFLGLGIANEIIAKVSQTGQVTVRPTSAVRKYTTQESDALAAARELQVDAVLDGTYLRVGDRLRITVNLLRVSDGMSLWAESFDQKFTDIFTLQDLVSKQVAERLWLRLNPNQQERLNKRYTSNPQAYSYYSKAMYHFYNISPTLENRSESELAVELFKKAITLDPEYALAHAQLGYAYTKTAVFQEDNPKLIEEAKQELALAEKLDPQLAEVHLARYFIAFSQYGGWSIDTAFRELRLGQQLDSTIGHPELLDLYAHIGLEKNVQEQLDQGLNADPNSDEIKGFYVNALFISGRPDEGLEASRKLLKRSADLRYFVEKKMVKEAQPLAREELQKDPSAVWKLVYQALLMSLEGRHKEAQGLVPAILAKERRYRGYHHDTYNIARIYALDGKANEAVKWMRVTIEEGFPHYPLFERDTFLDRIRDTAAFKEFMIEMKTRWEAYRREFG